MLEDLEARWRNERTPQAGVRLAEALQQQGDRVRAEGILGAVEARLEAEPRNLASRVAAGAVYLALAKPADAARILEQVVQADPTHLKANKLLVEVYLELDERDRARDRLDLYRLLNEGDPEIEALEGLVVGVTLPAFEPEPVAAGVRAPAAGGRRLRLAGGDPFAALTAEAPPAPQVDLFADAGPAPREAAPEATATLGALYQEQGHAEEAERVYRDVLAEEPDNLLAQEGLAALAAEPSQEPAGSVPVAALPGDEAEEADRRRRIGVVRDYLARIQRGREAAAR